MVSRRVSWLGNRDGDAAVGADVTENARCREDIGVGIGIGVGGDDTGFGHEKRDVSRAAIEYVGWAYRSCETLKGHRNAKDQLLRASHAIPLNMAEGHGKATHGNRRRDFERARGSALECGAARDVRQASGAMRAEDHAHAKALLDRIVAMLTKRGQRGSAVHETPSGHGAGLIDTDSDRDPDTDGGKEPRDRQHAHAAERCRAR